MIALKVLLAFHGASAGWHRLQDGWIGWIAITAYCDVIGGRKEIARYPMPTWEKQ